MLTFTGKGRTSTCDGVTRRDFLQVGTLGAIGFGLPQWFAAQAAGAVKPGADDRACIMIFNLGAPSNMDLWDMKPDAPAEIRGPFKPIATASPAIQVSEILPRHATIADKFSLVRSVHHGGAAVHDAGWQMMQTGRLFTGGVNTPHVGSVVSYLEGPQDRPAAVRRAARADGPRRRQPAQRSGRRLPGQGARPVLAQRRPVAARLPRARPAAAQGDRQRPARPPAQDPRARRRRRRARSRRPRTPRCSTATSSRRSG